MTESDRAALLGLLAELTHSASCASLRCTICGLASYECWARHGDADGGNTHEFQPAPCNCPHSKLSAGIAELLREKEELAELQYVWCKEGESISERLTRERNESLMLMGMLAKQKDEVARLTAELGEWKQKAQSAAEGYVRTRDALRESYLKHDALTAELVEARKALEPFAQAFRERWMQGNQIVWKPQSLKAYREADEFLHKL